MDADLTPIKPGALSLCRFQGRFPLVFNYWSWYCGRHRLQKICPPYKHSVKCNNTGMTFIARKQRQTAMDGWKQCTPHFYHYRPFRQLIQTITDLEWVLSIGPTFKPLLKYLRPRRRQRSWWCRLNPPGWMPTQVQVSSKYSLIGDVTRVLK